MTVKVKTPKHLTAELKRWFDYYLREFDMDPSEQRILEMMADCWAEYLGLRKALTIAKSHTYVDRHGAPKERPELGAMNRCRITFARLRRELNLPINEPEEDTRIPRGGK